MVIFDWRWNGRFMVSTRGHGLLSSAARWTRRGRFDSMWEKERHLNASAFFYGGHFCILGFIASQNRRGLRVWLSLTCPGSTEAPRKASNSVLGPPQDVPGASKLLGRAKLLPG